MLHTNDKTFYNPTTPGTFAEGWNDCIKHDFPATIDATTPEDYQQGHTLCYKAAIKHGKKAITYFNGGN